MRKAIIVGIFMLLWTQAAFAHHLWVMKESDGFMVARGHVPDKIEAYEPACVKEVKGFDKNGEAVSVERKDEKDKVFLQPDKAPSMITLWCDWGVRVNTTRGKKLMSKKDALQAGLNVIDSFLSTHYAKSVFDEGPVLTEPVGLKLEIVPLKNPFQLKPDELLPVKLLFEGSPLANADVMVAADDEQNAKTNDEGIAQLRIGQKGVRLIWAQHKTPVENDPELDYHVFMTFFTFEVR